MENKQTPNLKFFTKRNKNGNSLIWKLLRHHDVIRKAVLLSNGFKDDFQSILRSLSTNVCEPHTVECKLMLLVTSAFRRILNFFSNSFLEFNSYELGRKIAPNTGANATKFFTLATKS